MKLDPYSPEGSDAIPYMRYGHSASAIGKMVYIFGGRNDTFGACNHLFCFDTGEDGSVVYNVGRKTKLGQKDPALSAS